MFWEQFLILLLEQTTVFTIQPIALNMVLLFQKLKRLLSYSTQLFWLQIFYPNSSFKLEIEPNLINSKKFLYRQLRKLLIMQKRGQRTEYRTDICEVFYFLICTSLLLIYFSNSRTAFTGQNYLKFWSKKGQEELSHGGHLPPTVKGSSHFRVLVCYLSHCSQRSKYWQEKLLQHAKLASAFSSTCKNTGPTAEINSATPTTKRQINEFFFQ